jgi:hypothetical protein
MSSDVAAADSNIIKIDLQVFKDLKDKENLKHIMNNKATLMKKKQEIQSSNCFHISYNPEHHYTNTNTHTNQHIHTHQNHHQNHNQHQHTQNSHKTHNAPLRQNRLYVITSDFTEDTKIKKQFIGYMNKLTENNKASLYEKIETLLASIKNHILLQSAYDTVWDFLGKVPDKLYIYVLKMFENSMTTKYIDNYVDSKVWYPPHYAFENNLLGANMEADQSAYDMYCDYVKWKKTTSNHNKAVLLLINDSHNALSYVISKLLLDLYSLFETSINATNPLNSHLTHFALEQIQLFANKNNTSYNEVVNKLRYINMDKLDSSSKFLILDILQL